jgi:hypothetical protein
MKGARAIERLRQERETFEVRKSQSRWWFALRFATVAVLLAIAVGVFVVGVWVLLSPSAYSPAVVKGSGIAIMLDLLAIGGATFAYTLRPASQPAFGPVTMDARAPH